MRWLTPATVPHSLREVVRSDVFKDMAAGDRVEVTDEVRYPKYAKQRWTFVSHWTNIRSGAQCVELWGGPAGNQMLIAVKMGSVRKLTGRR